MQRTLLGILLIVTAIAGMTAAPFFGHLPVDFSVFEAQQGENPVTAIFWGIRVPRVLLAFLCGAALGLGGMVFQAIFRNPLTTPFTLGVSSGAAFGAAAALKFHLIGSFMGIPLVSLCSLTGALSATVLVFMFSFGDQAIASYTMLLAGVAISFFFSSTILFMQYLSDFSESFTIVRWLMGSVETVGFGPVFQVLPFVVVGLILVLYHARDLDLLECGEELAASKGVEVKHSKYGLFFIVSLMVGGVVAVTGPIGFVGMMVPHVCKLILGPGHKLLTIVVFVLGGAFLVLCDTVARTIISPVEIPVGVITAILGGPFFIGLLARAVSPQKD